VLIRNVVLAAACLGLPAAAPAEVLLTPNVGVTFSGDTGQPFTIDDDTVLSWGAGLAFLGDGPLGFEIDFAHNPDFFGEGDEALLVPENNLTTLMGNLIVGGRFGGGSRLYVSAGAGIMKWDVGDAGELFDVGETDFGGNAGGGLILGLGDRLAIRGDIRYYRNFGGDDDEIDDLIDFDFGELSYWRGYAGLGIRF
jgi:opacity protein-like surface antigen